MKPCANAFISFDSLRAYFFCWAKLFPGNYNHLKNPLQGHSKKLRELLRLGLFFCANFMKEQFPDDSNG